MIYNVKISNGDRQSVFEYIELKRKEGKFTIVDIGGTTEGWSSPIIDAIIDFKKPIKSKKEYIDEYLLIFNIDITDPDQWEDVLLYVEKNGKFDFSICTHTLEDIINPGFVSRQITKISKEGYIATPSKHSELAIHEAYYVPKSEYNPETYVKYGHKGYMHHRWIFAINNNKLIGFPKIGYLDTVDFFDNIASNEPSIGDLSFFWKKDIEFEYINNNYLGPTSANIVSYFNNLRREDFI